MGEVTLSRAQVPGAEGRKGDGSLPSLSRTARVTGLWYLALAITGMLGFLMIRPRIFVEGDASATLANLVESAGLARAGLVLELAVVVAQAGAAVWFYKLFRSANVTASWALGVFGIGNAVVVLASAGLMATALAVSADSSLAPGADPAATVQLLYTLSTNAWGVGSLFFGLWLIPMGHVASGSGLMPRWLGRILVIGGVGYVLSAFVMYGVPGAPAWLGQVLPVPATIGEFWMIGYLLFSGVRTPGAA